MACPIFLSHRGESDDAPENTMESFRLAFERQTDGIELDVWIAGDGKLVVAHDGDLKRVAGSSRKITESTLGELRLDYPVPLLSEVLDELPPSTRLQIELKAGEGLVEAVQKTLESSTVSKEMVAISSFDLSLLRLASKAMPKLPLYYLMHMEWEFGSWVSPEKLAPLCASFGGTGICQLAHPNVRKEWVEVVHNAGYEVGNWGVKDDDLGLAMARAGVDRMTCNHAVALRRKWNDLQA